MKYKYPPLPKTITMLSDPQSGTMEVVHIDTLRQYAEQAVAPLLAEIDRLEEEVRFYRHEANQKVYP